jgi:mannan polymerase II complex MNN11 subunit
MHWSTLYSTFEHQVSCGDGRLTCDRWHGTILAKLAMVPQNLINAYANGPAAPQNGEFRQGDLVANFPGCDKDERDCAKEQQSYFDALDKA